MALMDDFTIKRNEDGSDFSITPNEEKDKNPKKPKEQQPNTSPKKGEPKKTSTGPQKDDQRKR